MEGVTMIYAVVVLAIVGGGVVCVAIFAAGIVAWNWLCEWHHTPHVRSYAAGFDDARNRLLGDAWWFGESPETCELLRDLARGVDVSQAREKWRKAKSITEASAEK
jgi:hypothetical protein